MNLGDLRKHKALRSQKEAAEGLGVSVSTVSRFEREQDAYISRIREYVEVLGGQLEIRVHLGTQAFVIHQYDRTKARPRRRRKALHPSPLATHPGLHRP